MNNYPDLYIKEKARERALAAVRQALADLLESALSVNDESKLPLNMFYSGKADAYETALSIIDAAFGEENEEEDFD